MGSGKFDPQTFFGRVDNVALHLPASELFGLLRRTLDLPAQWAALVTRTTGDHVVVPASGKVDAAGAEDVLFARVTPVDVVLEADGVATKDGYRCRAEVRLPVRLIPESSDLLSFTKAVLGSHRVALVEAIGRYLQPALRGALTRVAAEHDAATLIDSGSNDQVSAALADAVEASCFAAGLTLDEKPTAVFDSQTLRQIRESEQESLRKQADHAASRQVQIAREQAQAQHLDHLASLLGRLEEMTAASPDLTLPELVRTFSERERGEVYDALFAAEPVSASTQWVAVAAGDSLLFFDPHHPDVPDRRCTMAGDAGPVRSVQAVRDPNADMVLLLGAATGVYRWPVGQTETELTLLVKDAPEVRGGFNAATLVGNRIFASHSELGLLQWQTTEPASPRPLFESMTRNAKAVRGVEFFDGELYCAIDDRVVRWPADATGEKPSHVYTGSMTTITALCPTSDGLFAGNGDGDILHWPNGRETKPERLHTGLQRAAESIWVLESSGVRRLVYSDTSLHVHSRVLGDSYSCRYEAGGQTLRRVEVAPDVLVATNDLRDRMILWSPGHPDRPTAVVGVSRICGHSIQDICLVPKV
ncbi:MAG: hypothetical protein PVI86_04110 [Phycisphaerae bacterium]|jgi:hypothetical protein